MPTYSTTDDVRNALTPGGSGGTAATLLDDQVLDAINEADSLINTYLEIPQVRTPEFDDEAALPPLRYWSRNIAAYNATLTYRRGKDLPADDPVRLRYTQTLALLIDIRDGKMRSPIPLTVDPTGGGGDVEPAVFNQYTGTLFGPEDFQLAPSSPGATFYRPTTHWPG